MHDLEHILKLSYLDWNSKSDEAHSRFPKAWLGLLRSIIHNRKGQDSEEYLEQKSYRKKKKGRANDKIFLDELEERKVNLPEGVWINLIAPNVPCERARNGYEGSSIARGALYPQIRFSVLILESPAVPNPVQCPLQKKNNERRSVSTILMPFGPTHLLIGATVISPASNCEWNFSNMSNIQQKFKPLKILHLSYCLLQRGL